MTTAVKPSPIRFEGSVADLARDWTMSVRSTEPGPPRRIDGYTIGANLDLEGPGPHGGEVHPDGDEFLYVVSGVMELILDDGDERGVGTETRVVLRAGDAYVVPRGVWHRLEFARAQLPHPCHSGPNGNFLRRATCCPTDTSARPANLAAHDVGKVYVFSSSSCSTVATVSVVSTTSSSSRIRAR